MSWAFLCSCSKSSQGCVPDCSTCRWKYSIAAGACVMLLRTQLPRMHSARSVTRARPQLGLGLRPEGTAWPVFIRCQTPGCTIKMSRCRGGTMVRSMPQSDPSATLFRSSAWWRTTSCLLYLTRRSWYASKAVWVHMGLNLGWVVHAQE